MLWTASNTLALARQRCVHCLGIGMRSSWHAKQVPCACVFRSIFRICHKRYCTSQRRLTPVPAQKWGVSSTTRYIRRTHNTVVSCGLTWQEYAADFLLVGKRVLTEQQYRVFRLHYIEGLPWATCIRQIPALDRGEFFHECYRVEEKVGRGCAETTPYALFPIDEYFTPAAKGSRSGDSKQESVAPRQRMVRFPIRRLAA